MKREDYQKILDEIGLTNEQKSVLYFALGDLMQHKEYLEAGKDQEGEYADSPEYARYLRGEQEGLNIARSFVNGTLADREDVFEDDQK